MYDFSFPNDNEEKILDEYYKNEIKNIVFCYEIKEKNDLKIFERKNLIYYPKLNIYKCAILNIEEKKKSLNILSELFYSEKYYNDFLFAKAKKDAISAITNKYYFNGILQTQDISYIDIKKMKRNNLSILYSIKDIIKNKDIYSYIYLNKIIQKIGVDILIGSFATKKEEVPNRLEIIAMRKILGIRYSNKLMNRIFKRQLYRIRLAKRKDYFTKGYYIVKYPYEDCSEF